jgi:hypothetical protein
MKFEDEGHFVGPIDGKDLKNHPGGGGWCSRCATKTPRAPTRSTTTPSHPALRDLGPTSTATTRRLLASGKDN